MVLDLLRTHQLLRQPNFYGQRSQEEISYLGEKKAFRKLSFDSVERKVGEINSRTNWRVISDSIDGMVVYRVCHIIDPKRMDCEDNREYIDPTFINRVDAMNCAERLNRYGTEDLRK